MALFSSYDKASYASSPLVFHTLSQALAFLVFHTLSQAHTLSRGCGRQVNAFYYGVALGFVVTHMYVGCDICTMKGGSVEYEYVGLFCKSLLQKSHTKDVCGM